MTQSSPMDFEKEAREIAEELEQASFDYEFLLNSETKTDQALAKKRLTEARESFIAFVRRAYTAGQEDMRERAANFVEPEKPAPCDCIQQTAVDYGSKFSSSCYCRSVDDHARVVMWCSEMNEAARIRLLPLLSPDHEKAET